MNKDRPILFSGPMVRALLDGSKTQTRRICKANFISSGGALMQFTDDDIKAVTCPYAKEPGDRLWVRESFSGPHCMEASEGCAAVPPSKWGKGSSIWYWADGNPTHGDWTRPRPSMFMPRWASRITLEITGVRVERLQEISEADCIAEGIAQQPSGWWSGAAGQSGNTARAGYGLLWNSINGPGSWAANPLVWVVEFKRTI